MRSSALPTIATMAAGSMAFVVADEPTRTRTDAAAAASEALETITWARGIVGRAKWQADGKEPGARRLDDPEGPGLVRMERHGGSDVEIRLTVARHGEDSSGLKPVLSCIVAAQWMRPSDRALAAAFDLFGAAARGVLDPARGDEAMLDVRAHVVRALHNNDVSIAHITAATPWRTGGRKAAKGMIIPGRGERWEEVEGAFVVCVRTFAGITLAIEPLELTATAGMFDPMETLRLLARLDR